MSATAEASPRLSTASVNHVRALGAQQPFLDRALAAGFDPDFLRGCSFPRLSREAEHRLAITVQAGCRSRAELDSSSAARPSDLDELKAAVRAGERATGSLIEHNLDLLIRCALQVQAEFRGGLSAEDLAQEAFFGLARAAQRFDPGREYRFRVYASYWVRQAIWYAIANQSRTIRAPSHVAHELSVLQRLDHRESYGSEQLPSHEVARQLGVSQQRVEQLRRYATPPDSFDVIAALCDDEAEDAIDEQPSDLQQLLEERNVEIALDQLLSCLPARKQTVLIRHLGLQKRRQETLEAIAQDFGLTRERIRQLQQESITTLSHPRRCGPYRYLLSHGL